MARQAKTVELAVPGGLAATYANAHADGHAMAWSKDMLIHVKQGAGGRTPRRGTGLGHAGQGEGEEGKMEQSAKLSMSCAA